MSAADLISLYTELENLKITVWVDGGWGVDALLGEQTRPHQDLDIVVQERDVPRLRHLLQQRGYRDIKLEEARAWNFVLGDENGREIDLHVIVLDDHGNGLYGPTDKGYTYPASSLTGVGSISGRIVRCISPEWMVKFHSGYKLKEKDFWTSPRCAKSSASSCRKHSLNSRNKISDSSATLLKQHQHRERRGIWMARLARNLVVAQLAGEGKENCRSGSSNGELGRPYKAISLRSSEMEIKRIGSQPSAKGPSEWFAGTVRIDPLFQAPDPALVQGAGVTFEPSARTAWHTHPLGQTLIVTSGCGRAQHWGGPIEEIRPGDVIWFPPGEKHWHGATPTTAMTHIAIQEKLDGKVVDWLEQVSDEQYRAAEQKTHSNPSCTYSV